MQRSPQHEQAFCSPGHRFSADTFYLMQFIPGSWTQLAAVRQAQASPMPKQARQRNSPLP